jgi:hypothetical protein
MQADEFQEMKDSINIVGVLNPITLLDGMILDGWHRYTIATEFGMDCPTVELGDDVDPVDFVKAQNIARRKLTPSQTAFACTQLYAWRPPHREKKVAVTATLSKTNAELAAIAGTGERTIRQAKAVQAGAVPAVQDAVTAGTVSLETAAAVAKLPAAAQQALAVQGPDAMRVATKSRGKSVTCDTGVRLASPHAGVASDTSAPATKTQKQIDAEQNAADAHGDSDPIAMLEASEAENAELRSLLAAAEADDKQAEIIKWHRMTDVAQRRQNELMDTVNSREKELQRMANWLRRIGTALDELDNSKLPALVEALAQTAKAHAQTLYTPALLAGNFSG